MEKQTHLWREHVELRFEAWAVGGTRGKDSGCDGFYASKPITRAAIRKYSVVRDLNRETR